jgi:hypothetical protein
VYQQSSRKETSRKIFQNQSKNFLKPDYFLPETNLRIFHNQISFETKPAEERPETNLVSGQNQSKNSRKPDYSLTEISLPPDCLPKTGICRDTCEGRMNFAGASC